MNPTTEPIHVDARCQQAAERVQHLAGELEQLQRRRQEAAQTVESLNVQIAQQERSGDAEVLAEIRQARRDAGDVQTDLGRTIAQVEQELRLAQDELRAAEVSCQAERYNSIVTQQRELTQTIGEALDTITASVKLKEELATKQDRIQGNTCPYPNLSPAGVRWAILEEITKRLQLAGAPTPLLGLDWSSRRMTSGGALE